MADAVDSKSTPSNRVLVRVRPSAFFFFMSYVLQVQNLTKVFKGQRRLFKSKELPSTALNNLSFNLTEGEILGILGPNGAGKTTLIEMLLGTLKPTSGKINYFGLDFYKNSYKILKNLSHASAYNKLPTYLTVEENLEIFGSLYEMPSPLRKKRIDLLLQRFGMEKFREKAAGTLSAGQMTRVMLIKAFLPSPKVILLDEPTASLDPDIAKEVRSFILSEQKERKVSIILTSHNMQEVAEVCDRALVLQRGVVTKEDTPEMLAKSVALSDLTLNITQNLDKAIAFIEQQKWLYNVIDSELKVELDEAFIPHLLKKFAELNIDYSRIDIAKPTLEDYFLNLVQEQRK